MTLSTVQAVERALDILEALAVTPSGVSDVARRTGLPKSTAARLLATLEGANAVERGPDGVTYNIGHAIRGLAAAVNPSANLATLSGPLLLRLAAVTGEAAGFSIPDGYRVHYVSQVDSTNPVQVRDWTGELIPMHLVPSGLVVMAHWPAARLDHFLDRPLEAPTPNTITDPEQIRQRLARILEEGHVWVYEEFVEGMNSVAAAVVDEDGHVLGAVHVHGPAYRFPAQGGADDVAVHVRDAVKRLSEARARWGD